MNFINRIHETKDLTIKLMRVNDLVIIYMGHSSLIHFYLKENEIYHNKFGAFHHNDIIGKPFGSKIPSRISTGWIYVLEPTPELWSMALNTRTQIVNETDSSVIVTWLDLYPGCKVVESGTGSGCMTMSLARAVFPNGHVYTFEYNQIRATMAQEEFNRLKLGHMITVSHRDICGKFREDEAGFNTIEANSVDSVFFDLPEPWLALPYALHILKPSRPICCYSPCIEQVMKTCEVLRSLGFYNISMIEVRQKPYDGRVIQLEHADLGLNEGTESILPSTKRLKTCSITTTTIAAVIDKDDEKEMMNSQRKKEFPSLFKPRTIPSSTISIARPITTMKGHSAFLTFAMRPCTSLPTAVDTLQNKETKP